MGEAAAAEPAGAEVALVTGASEGIGAAIARRLARGGRRVALVARGAERLDGLANELGAGRGRALAVPADLSDAAARAGLVRRVEEEWGRVDVLVNNAGFGTYARLEEMAPETVRAMFELNVLAAVEITQSALAGMRRRRHGHVVNIASLAGHIAAPPLTVYAASKSAVIAFSRSLHRELRGTGVHVTAISPGPVRTSFGRVASGRAVDPAQVPGGITPERVARAVERALRHPRREVILPSWYAGAVLAELLVPGLVDRFAAGRERAWLRAVERADPN